PVVMGSWMCDGGFSHGLTLRAYGGVESAAAVASIVWVAFKRIERPPVPVVEVPKKRPRGGPLLSIGTAFWRRIPRRGRAILSLVLSLRSYGLGTDGYLLEQVCRTTFS